MYNRATRFGPKLELATMRYGGTPLNFGTPIAVAVVVVSWRPRGAAWELLWGPTGRFQRPFLVVFPILKMASVRL